MTDVATEINDLKNDIKELTKSIDALKCSYNAIQLDTISYVKTNNNIKPGCYPKIAFDSKGLVVSGSELTSDDIPELSLNKIPEAAEALKNKVNRSDLDSILKGLDKFINRNPIPAGTGTKINYDSNGNILSSSDLIVNDIPEMPISKITGLTNRLSIIEDSIKSYNDIPENNSNNEYYDSTIYQLTNRINKIESVLISMSSLKSINDRIDSLENTINNMMFKK